MSIGKKKQRPQSPPCTANTVDRLYLATTLPVAKSPSKKSFLPLMLIGAHSSHGRSRLQTSQGKAILERAHPPLCGKTNRFGLIAPGHFESAHLNPDIQSSLQKVAIRFFRCYRWLLGKKCPEEKKKSSKGQKLGKTS